MIQSVKNFLKMQLKGTYFDPWQRAFLRLPVDRRTAEDLVLDEAAVFDSLTAAGLPVEPIRIDGDLYRDFRKAADYESVHPGYYSENLTEKSLEHFLSATEANLKPGNVVIDIASQNHVVGEVFERLYGVEVYRQDLDYPAGLNGKEIGGDAAKMPVEDEFADALTLHCSFEHFEGESDSGFIREAERVLKPGGVLLIVPIYFAQHYACITYPPMSAGSGVPFEPDMRIHALKHWQNRFGRFYDADHFVRRVWSQKGRLAGKILKIENYREFGEGIYLRYALKLKKPGC